MSQCKGKVSVNEDDIQFTGFVMELFSQDIMLSLSRNSAHVRHWLNFELFDVAFFAYCLEM